MAAKRSPQSVLSSTDDGYAVQFEELKGDNFVCRKCSFHPLRDDARVHSAPTAIKHLKFLEEDGHRIDPKAMQELRNRLLNSER